MNLLYICDYFFYEKNEAYWALPFCSDIFFQKYLDVFDNIKVIGVNPPSFIDKNKFSIISDKRISVRVLPPNTYLKDFKNDRIVKAGLCAEIKKSDAILIRPTSRRGMMAIKLAEKFNKPYMIEMIGDIHNALRQSPSILKKMYAPIIYHQIKKAIKSCKYGLYVSQSYLQEQYPIQGVMCGCADVILEKSDERILECRVKKIDAYKFGEEKKLALIGFYQGKMKGVDTAIRALGRLDPCYHLYILGFGTQKNREKWFLYAEKNGVSKNRIHFPEPLSTPIEVLHWLDSIDAFVLPTRSEGFGRCVAEAMSRGCPCFATNICTMPELLSKDCLFELNNDKQMAEIIDKSFQNKEKLKELAKRNFEKSKEYDADALKQRRDEFLKQFSLYAESFGKVRSLT